MTNDWIDNLNDVVAEKIEKHVRFKTHKQKKEFFGGLRGLIKSTIELNTLTKVTINTRDKDTIITKPHTKESVGHAIMDSGLSAKGDEILGVGVPKNND